MSYTIPTGIQESSGGGFFNSVGVFAVHVDKMHERMIGEPGKYGITADLTIVEPGEVAGQTASVNFFLGTDADPGTLEERVQPETFVSRAGRLKAFCAAAGVDIEGQDLEVTLSDMQDRVLKGRTTAEKEPKTFLYGKRKGQVNEKYQGRYNLNWAQWMKRDEGPACIVQTTTAKLREADEARVGGNGAAGQPTAGSTGTSAPPPPPPPSPSGRTATR